MMIIVIIMIIIVIITIIILIIKSNINDGAFLQKCLTALSFKPLTFLCKKPSSCFSVDKRHRFNVDTTSYDIALRRIIFETTSCFYGVNRVFYAPLKLKFVKQDFHQHKSSLKKTPLLTKSIIMDIWVVVLQINSLQEILKLKQNF